MDLRIPSLADTVNWSMRKDPKVAQPALFLNKLSPNVNALSTVSETYYE